MTNSAPEDDAVIRRATEQLQVLSPRMFSRTLLQYALDVTISARMHFQDGRTEAAEGCNETLHLLLGFLSSETESTPCRARESLARTIARDAQHKGRIHILQQAITKVPTLGND